MAEAVYNGYMSRVSTVNSSLRKKNVHVDAVALLPNK